MGVRLWALAVLGFCGSADAHLMGLPEVARPLTPEAIEAPVDTSFELVWYDSDTEEEGTTIQWWYGPSLPPTFDAWSVPDSLVGEPIGEAVPLQATPNTYLWDTSAIPTGVYFVWGVTHDQAVDLAAIAPGVLTVSHPGDAIPPAAVLLQSDVDSHLVDTRYKIHYASASPEAEATVTLEASRARDVVEAASDIELFAITDGLAAGEVGQWDWDTSTLPQGDYRLRVTVTDAEGRSFSAWGRYFVTVLHVGEEETPVVPIAEPDGDASGFCTSTRDQRLLPHLPLQRR